jgi:cytochrome c oxidase subunit 2
VIRVAGAGSTCADDAARARGRRARRASPAGPQAAHIYDVSIIITAVCALVLWRSWSHSRSSCGAHRAAPPPRRPMSMRVDRASARLHCGCVGLGVSAVLLFGLVVASVFTDRALAQLALHDAINIEMTGHMWWWEIKYTDGTPQQVFVTANEIHVPVGRP